LVEGIDEIKTNIASCCNPIPGDNIVGYISKGNGINIHRSICPNISDLEERIIDVNWNTSITKKYLTGVLVYTNELKNILVDIVAKTSSLDIMVQSVNTITSTNSYIFEIYVLVQDIEKLNKFMRELESLNSVTKVERLIK
jgi:GTP pyrophosphokinase